MGRGRKRAKQTKVARQLKYYSPETDLEALERELARSRSGGEDYVEEDIPPATDPDGWSEPSR